MPAPTPDPKTPAAAVAPPRVIPGLSLPSGPAPSAPKPRKRGSKHKVPTTGTVDASSPAGVDAEGDKGDVGVIPEVPLEEDDLVIEEKKTSAVEAVHKRIRSLTKKLQRIEGYEASTGTLNADQQRAIQGKGALEAVARELNELLVILKAEEVEDEERNKRVAAVEEKKQARAIDAAVQASKVEAQQHLVLLFQFLHLHGLYNPSQTSFAPPVLPPVVANATGSDVAAIRMLYDAFTNGPLLGGNDDALEKLVKISEARHEEVLPGTGVTYGRVRELIHGLTAPPEDVRAPPASDDALANETVDDLVAQSNEPAGKADSIVALVDGATEAVHPPPPGAQVPSFLQPSEVETSQAGVATPPATEKVQHWAQDIAFEAQGPPPSGPSTPAPDASFGSDTSWTAAPTTPAAVTPFAAPAEGNHAVAAPASQAQEPTLDWAEDDGEGGLPHLDELAPPVPVVALPPSTGTPPASDGFQPARQARRGSGRGRGGEGPHRPRGAHRGRGGRGGAGAGANGAGRSESFQREPRAPRELREGQETRAPREPREGQEPRGPRAPRPERGETGEGRGSYRGNAPRGGTRSGGRGRGRGGASGGAQAQAAPAAAAV